VGFGLAQNLEVAGGAAVFGGLYSYAIYRLARADRLHGRLIYVIFIPFISLPTFFFLATHFLMPAGAATYITGPFSYLYFHLILMTGFVFDARLSIWAGVVSALGYLGCFLLAQPELARIQGVETTLRQDLIAPPIYVFKGILMIAMGYVTAAFSRHARRLIRKVLGEKERRGRVDRLFGQYVSDEIKSYILEGGHELRGSRERVAVLFSDIRGFSTFSETRDPEAIVTHLNVYFDRMVEAIRREQGVVDKFIGDAVMAVFGGVSPVERPCDASVRAALAMRDNLAALNATWRAEGQAPFDNGVGIEFGEVLQGPIGSEDRKEFTVIGDAVNTAARVESLTKCFARPVVVTETVFRELSEPLQARFEPIGEEQVKGKERPVRVYGLIGDPQREPAAPGSEPSVPGSEPSVPGSEPSVPGSDPATYRHELGDPRSD
jgi:class 3 adenylate cyclase